MSIQPIDRDFVFSEEKRVGFQVRNPSTHSKLKRGMDIILAAGALVFFLPVMIVVSVMIRLQDGGSALFVQERIGVNGKMFKCFKFRSMVTNAQERLDHLLETDPAARAEWDATQKLENDPRITALGRFLRQSSFDELPQLFNILKGEMSVVGPRPIIRNEIKKYGLFFENYCEVRPGLTGLWQVSGRSETTYDERVEMDVTYAQDWSVMGDVKIIAKTIPAIVSSRGAC